MATQEFKLAVNNARFPFLYQHASRSVLQTGLDVAPRVGGGFSGGSESIDYNTVQMLYCENVLPTSYGLMTVGTREELAAFSPPTTVFDQLITLRDSDERNFLFCPARGQNFVYEIGTSAWTSYDSFVWAPERTLVSKAYLDGRTFICYEANRIIEWDPVLQQFNTLAITLPAGYSISDIRGISGASNYLLLHTLTEVFWSSTLDILNFDDPIGKSGRQTPIDLKGPITAIISISGGFIIYTTRNAVAAFFTNSADTPFSFREVTGSGGVAGYEQVTGDANQSDHYTYGNSGLQRVNLQRAETIFPDCTDFLASRLYESWDVTTMTVVERTLVDALQVKVHYFDNRYLFLSYGYIDGQYTFALVWDSALNRWGKIRVDHVDIGITPNNVLDAFDLEYYDLSGSYNDYATVAYQDLVQAYGELLPIRTSIVFLQNTGALRILVSDPASDSPVGLAIFGHVQVTRSRTVTFLGATLDGLYGLPAPTLTLLGSAPGDGYNRNKIIQANLGQATDKSCQYRGRDVFENFDLALQGKMVLSNAIVKTMIHGSR